MKAMKQSGKSQFRFAVTFSAWLWDGAPAGCAWVTVMGNMNTLAVATLADVACVIMGEGAALDEIALKKAQQQEITVLATELPVFEAALWIWQQLHG